MSTTNLSAEPETTQSMARDKTEKGPKQIAHETAEHARNFVKEKGKAASDIADVAVTEISDGLTKASDAARDFATKQPVATVAGALAVGILVGLAINSRR